MTNANLSDMIHHFENGTNLHIAVTFFSKFGNDKTRLDYAHKIHSSHICLSAKYSSGHRNTCLKCRDYIINKVVTTKTASWDVCPFGLSEYTLPIFSGDSLVCIVFIGNILESSKGYERIKRMFPDKPLLIQSAETGFNYEKCVSMGQLIESYICMLLDKEPIGNDSLMLNILNYIEENCDSDIRIDRVANAFHYNKQYFGRLIKKLTAMSFSSYVNDIRLKKAKELLENSNHSIITISQRVGFSNVTYFNKQFKKRFKTTPLQMRKQNKQ